MGFIISFDDIVGIPTKIFSPDPESIKTGDSSQIELVYYIQIDLYNTGFVYLAGGEQKARIENMRERGRTLASFCIKINRKNLLNELLMNEEREVIAEKILANIVKGKSITAGLKKEEQSFTNVPCFDINFKNILINEKELEEGIEINDEPEDIQEGEEEAQGGEEEKQEEEIEENNQEKEDPMSESSPIKGGSRVANVGAEAKADDIEINAKVITKNFKTIMSYFGAHDKINSVDKLNNQSMQPLDFLFPEIEKTEEQIIQANKTVLDKSESRDVTHNVKLLSFNPEDPKTLEMHPGSDFVTEWLKTKVRFK